LAVCFSKDLTKQRALTVQGNGKYSANPIIFFITKCLLSVAYPGILFRRGVGGSTNSFDDRENGDLGALAPC